MRSSQLRAAIVLGLAASLLLLSGCGNDEPPADAASASATPTPTPTSASPSASSTPTPTPKPKPIKASNDFDKVTVTGSYGDTPKVKVDTPWAIDKTRAKVLDASNGPVISEGQSVRGQLLRGQRANREEIRRIVQHWAAGCFQLGAGRAWLQQRADGTAQGQPCA